MYVFWASHLEGGLRQVEWRAWRGEWAWFGARRLLCSTEVVAQSMVHDVACWRREAGRGCPGWRDCIEHTQIMLWWHCGGGAVDTALGQ